MTETTTKTLTCVLIPMSDRQLLLPNVSVAEVVDHTTELAGDDGPAWLAGFLEWRGRRLPVLSYEGANGGEPIMPDASRGRILVLNTIGPDHARLPFLALVTQGIPSQAKLEPEQVLGTDQGEQGPADLLLVDLEGEPVWIPNLEYMESLGVQALDQA